MKKRMLCLALLLAAMLLVAACGAPPDAIQWQEPALEALVREKLDKPKGAITPADLEHIWGIELFGDTHIFFNAEGGYEMFNSVDNYGDLTSYAKIPNPSNIKLQQIEDGEDEIIDGTYWVGGEQYERGSISGLADFANFRNLKYLYVYKNALTDFSGLSALEDLTEVRLTYNDIQDISAMAELQQISSLNISRNQVTDVSPLGDLVQLRQLLLRFNQISDMAVVANLHDLEILNVMDNPIASLESVKKLEQLDSLYFDNTLVDDISPLTGKTALIRLSMENLNAERVDLTPLGTLPKLRSIFMRQNKAELLNFRVLGEIENLIILDIRPNMNVSDEDIAWLRKRFPDCSIQ